MRHLLLITYYFPPSGVPGVQRPLKFAKYLRAFGWQPTVLTVRPEAAAYPDVDPAMLDEVPSDMRVLRTGAWDPYTWYARLQGKTKKDTVGVGFVGEAEQTWQQRLGRWLRANVFLPDARVGWVPAARRAARQHLKTHRINAILTTGPPHSTHLIGRALAKQFGLPWVADFRDPWTGIDFYAALPMSSVARHLDARMGRRVLNEADAVLTVGQSMQNRLQRLAPNAQMLVLENGYDPVDFPAPPPLTGPFAVTYIGNMNAARNPESLWQALTRLDISPREVQVHLTGNIDPVVLRAVDDAGVAAHVTQDGYVAHAEAVRRMQGSGVQLLVINRVEGNEGILTGKLFEYLASGRPVLGIGPVAGDAARILRETGAGQMFDYEDVDGIATFLREHVAAWQASTPREGATPEAHQPWSRRAQTERLAALLDQLARDQQRTSNSK